MNSIRRAIRISPARRRDFESGRRDSNPRPSPWQGDALPLRHFRVVSHLSRRRLHSRRRHADPGPTSPPGSRPATDRAAPVSVDSPACEQDEKTAVLSKSFGAVADDYDRLRRALREALDWLLPDGATDVLESVPDRASSPACWPNGSPMSPPWSPMPGCWRAPPLIRGRPRRPGPGAPRRLPLLRRRLPQSAWRWVDESRAIPEPARVPAPRRPASLVWTGPDRTVDWTCRSLWAGTSSSAPRKRRDQDSHRKGRHVVNINTGGVDPS